MAAKKKTAKPSPNEAPKRAAAPFSANHLDGLRAKVLASPDDAELVAVYADALIEAGDPRGTFISEQVALAELSPLDPRYAPLLASTWRLEAEHGASWIGDYLARSKLAETHGSVRTGLDRHLNAVFERGFLRRIAMTPELIAKEWPKLTEREPITGMELLVRESLPEPYRLLREPETLTRLKVSPDDWFTAHSVANVLAWEMPRLGELDLSGCDLGQDGARLLANQETDLGETFEGYTAPPPFAVGQLRRLILRAGQLGNAGASILLGAPHLTALEELDISQCRIDDPAILEQLRRAPALRNLRRLAIAGNQGFGPGLGALAGWPALGALEALTLPQTTTAEALRALFKSPSRSLHTLDVASAKGLLATPEAILRTSESLAFLDIGTTSVGDAGFAKLVQAESARTLVSLSANGCSLSDEAVRVLTTSKLDRLVELDLSSNKLSDRSLSMLAAWPGVAQLTRLRLRNNRKLSSVGYDALAEAPGFRPAMLDGGKVDAKLAAKLEARFPRAWR